MFEVSNTEDTEGKEEMVGSFLNITVEYQSLLPFLCITNLGHC